MPDEGTGPLMPDGGGGAPGGGGQLLQGFGNVTVVWSLLIGMLNKLWRILPFDDLERFNKALDDQRRLLGQTAKEVENLHRVYVDLASATRTYTAVDLAQFELRHKEVISTVTQFRTVLRENIQTLAKAFPTEAGSYVDVIVNLSQKIPELGGASARTAYNAKLMFDVMETGGVRAGRAYAELTKEMHNAQTSTVTMYETNLQISRNLQTAFQNVGRQVAPMFLPGSRLMGGFTGGLAAATGQEATGPGALGQGLVSLGVGAGATQLMGSLALPFVANRIIGQFVRPHGGAVTAPWIQRIEARSRARLHASNVAEMNFRLGNVGTAQAIIQAHHLGGNRFVRVAQRGFDRIGTNFGKVITGAGAAVATMMATGAAYQAGRMGTLQNTMTALGSAISAIALGYATAGPVGAIGAATAAIGGFGIGWFTKEQEKYLQGGVSPAFGMRPEEVQLSYLAGAGTPGEQVIASFRASRRLIQRAEELRMLGEDFETNRVGQLTGAQRRGREIARQQALQAVLLAAQSRELGFQQFERYRQFVQPMMAFGAGAGETLTGAGSMLGPAFANMGLAYQERLLSSRAEQLATLREEFFDPVGAANREKRIEELQLLIHEERQRGAKATTPEAQKEVTEKLLQYRTELVSLEGESERLLRLQTQHAQDSLNFLMQKIQVMTKEQVLTRETLTLEKQIIDARTEWVTKYGTPAEIIGYRGETLEAMRKQLLNEQEIVGIHERALKAPVPAQITQKIEDMMRGIAPEEQAELRRQFPNLNDLYYELHRRKLLEARARVAPLETGVNIGEIIRMQEPFTQGGGLLTMQERIFQAQKRTIQARHMLSPEADYALAELADKRYELAKREYEPLISQNKLQEDSLEAMEKRVRLTELEADAAEARIAVENTWLEHMMEFSAGLPTGSYVIPSRVSPALARGPAPLPFTSGSKPIGTYQELWGGLLERTGRDTMLEAMKSGNKEIVEAIKAVLEAIISTGSSPRLSS